MKTHRRTSFFRYTKDGLVEIDEAIVVESSVDLWLEDMHLVSFVASAGYEKELCLGYLITSGIVSDISEIEFSETSENQCVITSKRKSQVIQSFLMAMTKTSMEIPPFEEVPPMPVSPFIIKESINYLMENQELHSLTGATHGAMIVHPKSKDLKIIEDMGRHNALDKVVGFQALKGINLSECLLFVTGRLTSEMVSKAAYARIPLMGSLTFATDLGIQIASNVGMTLLGSLKQDEFWLYNQGSVIPFKI